LTKTTFSSITRGCSPTYEQIYLGEWPHPTNLKNRKSIFFNQPDPDALRLEEVKYFNGFILVPPLTFEVGT